MAPIHEAATSGDMAVVMSLVEANPDVVNAMGHLMNPFTPLHIASKIGHLEMMAYLLDHGANINQGIEFIRRRQEDPSRPGITPLAHACFNGAGRTWWTCYWREGQTPPYVTVLAAMPCFRPLTAKQRMWTLSGVS